MKIKIFDSAKYPAYYVLLRTIVDMVFFIFTPAEKLANSFGWPVNAFWVQTVLPVTLAMMILTFIAIQKGKFDLGSLVLMLVVSIHWGIYLIIVANSTTMMRIDGISWLLVSVAVIFYNFWKKQ